MVNINDYDEVRECDYKGEHYSVRDNGAIMRHQREGRRKSKYDNVWLWGKFDIYSGYLKICSEPIHRIVATAFHGEAPSNNHVVDHIDTNRRNNRPENLRWLTKLENILNNPITVVRIVEACGSIEAFLNDPSILKGHENSDPNFSWMRTVTPEEAKISYERLMNWAKDHPKPQGGKLGEWIFEKKERPAKNIQRSNHFSGLRRNITEPEQVEPEVIKPLEVQSLTPNAVQVDWRTPSEFPCCPQDLNPKDNPLEAYLANLKKDAIFCKNNIYRSLVIDSVIIDEEKLLLVMTRSDGESVKPWALAKVVFENGVFKHISMGSYFDEKGAKKYFTLTQGKEWTGGDVIDDYC